ncbi:MAG: hypothetical protein Q8R05_04900 [Candidatus Omnitrophota bacterium]|nr:hypothetical protein [Candidatus Omnitrophota bacterium]
MSYKPDETTIYATSRSVNCKAELGLAVATRESNVAKADPTVTYYHNIKQERNYTLFR